MAHLVAEALVRMRRGALISAYNARERVAYFGATVGATIFAVLM